MNKVRLLIVIMLYLVKHPYSWTLNDETKRLVFFIDLAKCKQNFK